MSDESVQRPSPLVSSFAPATFAVPRHQLRIPSRLKLSRMTHGSPCSTPAFPPAAIRALKRQAECPFQAFVFHRLGRPRAADCRPRPVAWRPRQPVPPGDAERLVRGHRQLHTSAPAMRTCYMQRLQARLDLWSPGMRRSDPLARSPNRRSLAARLSEGPKRSASSIW